MLMEEVSPLNLNEKFSLELKPAALRIGVIVVAVLVLTAVLTYLIWFNDRLTPGLTVAGQEVGGLKVAAAQQIIGQFSETVRARKVILNYRKRTLSVVLGTIGINVDVGATTQKAYRAGRTGHLGRQIAARLRIKRNGLDLHPVFKNNRESLEAFYRLLEAGIAIEPVRSVVSLDDGGRVNYTPSRIGRMIDHDALTALLEQAAWDPKLAMVDIPVKTLTPSLTEGDIEKWGLNRVLGVYSTKFNPAHSDRSHNLSLASRLIDNVLIYPGQNFSFNTWVGPRISESGYKEAPVVLFGKLVPGVGGGVCQVSSTLYNAVLLANMKVVSRANHSLPGAYVPLARDATVSYDSIDFIFENNNPTPVLIVTRLVPPHLTVAVLGRKTDWESVALETVEIASYPYSTKEIPDPTLPAGERVKAFDGVMGHKVELWRKVVMKDGSVKKRRENISIYPAQPEEYKVGTGRSGAKDGRVGDAATTRGAP
jgi:vancomycin resistance protein YoaR